MECYLSYKNTQINNPFPSFLLRQYVSSLEVITGPKKETQPQNLDRSLKSLQSQNASTYLYINIHRNRNSAVTAIKPLGRKYCFHDQHPAATTVTQSAGPDYLLQRRLHIETR